jgi:hypothetical protein
MLHFEQFWINAWVPQYQVCHSLAQTSNPWPSIKVAWEQKKYISVKLFRNSCKDQLNSQLSLGQLSTLYRLLGYPWILIQLSSTKVPGKDGEHFVTNWPVGSTPDLHGPWTTCYYQDDGMRVSFLTSEQLWNIFYQAAGVRASSPFVFCSFLYEFSTNLNVWGLFFSPFHFGGWPHCILCSQTTRLNAE